jgi:hypothetical protein
MKSSKELSIGMWKYMKKGGGKKAVDDMMIEFGEEATEAALKKVGKSTLVWQKLQVERLAFIIKNPPPGGDRIVNNIDSLINTKGIQGRVDALWGSFDHKNKKVWMETRKGISAELQIASEEIKPENIRELGQKVKIGIEETDIDILAKNPNRGIQVKNINNMDKKDLDKLGKQLRLTKNKHPDYARETYIPKNEVTTVTNGLRERGFNVDDINKPDYIKINMIST